tara:strand:+ start:637 stop:831 length:195 start_codon:yes stop_codon:yes gene_type:complete
MLVANSHPPGGWDANTLSEREVYFQYHPGRCGIHSNSNEIGPTMTEILNIGTPITLVKLSDEKS